MMTGMWLPPAVDRDLRAQTQGYVLELTAAQHSDRVCEEFTRELKRIDPYLELIRAAPNATAVGLVPGFYHVLRNNPGAPPSLMPVTDEEGGFREPDSGVFEQLRRNDMWSERSLKERDRVARELEKSGERRRQREHEERVAEMMERISAGRDVRVSMGGRWTQGVAGRRGAKS